MRVSRPLVLVVDVAFDVDVGGPFDVSEGKVLSGKYTEPQLVLFDWLWLYFPQLPFCFLLVILLILHDNVHPARNDALR